MTRLPALVLGAFVLALAACSPSVTVGNTAPFPVRAIVIGEDGTRNVHLVLPGVTVNGDVPEGPYVVTIVPDAQWLEYAQALRGRLVDRLVGAPDLSGAALTEIAARLAEIGPRLRAFERAAGGATCRGTLQADAIATAEIVIRSDGSLGVTCSGAPEPASE